MKAEYIQPGTRIIKLDVGNGAVICASGFNTSIAGREIEED